MVAESPRAKRQQAVSTLSVMPISLVQTVLLHHHARGLQLLDACLLVMLLQILLALTREIMTRRMFAMQVVAVARTLRVVIIGLCYREKRCLEWLELLVSLGVSIE
jgi:hypothetical protein